MDVVQMLSHGIIKWCDGNILCKQNPTNDWSLKQAYFQNVMLPPIATTKLTRTSQQ